MIGEDTQELKKTLRSLGIYLKEREYGLNVKPLLRVVLSHFFGPPSAFVDMVVDHIPSPVENAARKVEQIYTGPLDTEVAEAMKKCDPDGPLVIHVTKLYDNEEATGFDAFGRVFSGTVRPGQVVRVLGEGYSIDDEEDMTMQKVLDAWIYESRQVSIRFFSFMLWRETYERRPGLYQIPHSSRWRTSWWLGSVERCRQFYY